MGRTAATTIDLMADRLSRVERLALVRGHLLDHPRDILLSASALRRRLQGLGYDAGERTCQLDLVAIRENCGDTQAQLLLNLLVADSALEQWLADPERTPQAVVPILRERRATLQYRDALCSEDGSAGVRYNAYEEEERWRQTREQSH